MVGAGLAQRCDFPTSLTNVLVCVGDLLENILVVLPSELNEGKANRVRTARVRGGSAANVAALTAERGGKARFVGQIGDDTLGRNLSEDLERRGVELAVRVGGASGVVVTMIGKAGRTLLIDRATSSHLDAIDPSVLDDATQIYVPASAFVADPLATALDRLLGEKRRNQIDLFIGGPDHADCKDFGTEAFLSLIEVAKPAAVIMNSNEFENLGLGKQVCLKGARTTVVTNGSEPTMVLRANGTSEAVGVPRPGRMHDRTGVGDGFIAGFMASAKTGANAVSATHAGHRLAQKVLANLGPTSQS